MSDSPEERVRTLEAAKTAFRKVTAYWPPEWIQSDAHIEKMLDAVTEAVLAQPKVANYATCEHGKPLVWLKGTYWPKGRDCAECP